METTTKDVVLNNNPNAIDPAKQVAQVLDRLITDRQDWEVGAYRASNEMLYSILTKCYALDYGMSGNEEYSKKRRVALNDYAKKQGYNFKPETLTVNKIVKCVFGDVQRSRISAYSKVLREAKKQKVAIADLAKFIADNGGIQEIRMSKSATYKSPKQKAALAVSFLSTNKLAVVKSQKISEVINVEKVDDQCVLIAKQQADGSFLVQGVVYSRTALNAALVAMYGAENTQVKNKEEKQEAANDSDLRAAAIQSIVNQ